MSFQQEVENEAEEFEQLVETLEKEVADDQIIDEVYPCDGGI